MTPASPLQRSSHLLPAAMAAMLLLLAGLMLRLDLTSGGPPRPRSFARSYDDGAWLGWAYMGVRPPCNALPCPATPYPGCPGYLPVRPVHGATALLGWLCFAFAMSKTLRVQTTVDCPFPNPLINSNLIIVSCVLCLTRPCALDACMLWLWLCGSGSGSGSAPAHQRANDRPLLLSPPTLAVLTDCSLHYSIPQTASGSHSSLSIHYCTHHRHTSRAPLPSPIP